MPDRRSNLSSAVMNSNSPNPPDSEESRSPLPARLELPPGRVLLAGAAAGPGGGLVGALRAAGMKVSQAADLPAILASIAHEAPDVVLLHSSGTGDAGPDELAATVRQHSSLAADRVVCVPDWEKPAGIDAFVARVRALARLAQTEAALHEALEDRMALIDEAPIGMARLALEGVIVAANPSLAQMLRAPAGSLAGRSFCAFVHPDERESMRVRLRTLPPDRRPLYCETRLLAGDGTTIWARVVSVVRCHPDGSPQHISISVTDLTALKLAESGVAAREGLLRDLQELTHECIVQLDESGRIVHANRAFADALNRRPGSLVGLAFEDLVFASGREHWRKAFGLIGEGQVDVATSVDLSASEGVHLHLEGTLRRRSTDADPIVRGVFRDLTERRRLEAQLLRSQRLESIGTLAGGIAHDLNNVLAPVLLCVGLIRTGCSDSERLEFLRIIEKSALRGSDLVRQVLTFARGAEGELIVLHPKHVAREIVSILRETFPKTVRVVYDLPSDLWMVLGNATQLNQVLLNLCVNARDAMPGGGTLSLSGRNRSLIQADIAGIREARPGDYTVLSVSDTGTGIPSAIRDQIFDAFFTTKSPGHGTGLGLSTALGIVRAHGGFITVDTDDGLGTAFHVHLPAHPTGVLPSVPSESRAVPRGSRELVLVVDDERAVRDIVERTLADGGYRVITASDGIEAVARFMAFGPEIKLLVTDLLMPRLDGPQAIKAIRKSYPDICIVAMSGNPPPEIVERPHEAGIDRLVAKPFTGEDLLCIVHELITVARQARAGDGRSPASLPPVSGGSQPAASILNRA